MKKTKRKCFDIHAEHGVPCDIKECRQWMDYEEDLNCAVVCANKNGPLTLHETSARLGVSFVRIKQNQDRALQKLSKYLKKSFTEIFKT